jgi:hypothetical protein
MSLAGRSATRPSTLAPEDTDDAAWIAQRMVLEAGAQAARLRRQASAQAATICEAAERETEIVWQQASAQAAAIRQAAEREAAQLRAAVMKLSAGPLASIDRDVASLQAARLAGQPGIRRAAEPGARPARRPLGPPRQLVAIRVAAAATSALFLFALAAGTTEVALHGFAFFVFRSAGTGETSPHGLQEDQGPGQPDAPKPAPSHIKIRRSRTPHGHQDDGS